MIKVFESGSAEARLNAASEFVRGFPPASELLLIGPSRDAIDDFARENSGVATFGWRRWTLPQLAKSMAAADLAARGLARATALGAEAVAARAAFLLHRDNRLPYFAPVAEAPGFAAALASTLLELRMARVTPPQLVRDIMKLRGFPALDDLSLLLTHFEEQSRAAGIADWPMVLEVATAAAEREPAAHPVLLLDLAVHTPAERGFLKAFLAGAPEVLVTIPSGDELTLETFRECASIGLAGAGSAQSSLDRLRTYLFSTEQPPAAALDDRISFFSAPGEGRECVEIARRILREAHDNYIEFDRMAIFTRSPANYATVLETALARAGIPAYFERGARRPDPAGRAFLALLGCAVERLSARAFAEYLSLGQVPRPRDDGAPPTPSSPLWVAPEDVAMPEVSVTAVEEEPPSDSDDSPSLDGSLRAPWNWEKLLVEASVIGGGVERWRRRLDGLNSSLRFKISAIEREEGHSPRRDALERERRNLQHLRKFALPIIEKLAALPHQALWGVWLDAFAELAPMALRSPERVLALLAELRPMSEMGPVTLAEVREVLRGRLASLPQEPPENRYGRVLVAPLENARGRSFDIVFVPGLSERTFPQKLREDPLLLDALRIGLSPEGGLANQDLRASRERLLLRLAAGAARQRLYLSYARMELASSRSRVPSFYGLDVMRAITGEVPDYKVLERQAIEAAQARLAWPAPVDANLAVDESEYDLATLYPSLQPAAGNVKGRANFLLQLNPSLARSLRMRHWRWETPRWGWQDGLILPDRSPSREALEKHRLKSRAYSASALQRFAACPYQFFLAAILRLEPRPEVEAIEELDPRTRGTMFHQVQRDLLERLLEMKLLPVTAETFAAAEREMERVVTEVAELFAEKLAPAIHGVWQAGVDQIRADLRGWLRSLTESPEPWLPAYFEYQFGMGSSEAGEAEVAGGYRLRGAVDLIEGLYDVKAGKPTALRIIDHKTGVNRTKDDLQFGNGETLQPALYALAVEDLFPETKVRESVLSYCTSLGNFTRRVVPITDALRERSGEVLSAIDDAIAAGFLPPAPREGACNWCDFRAVCGPHEEIRWRKKRDQRREVEDLQWLRGLP